MFIRKVLSSGLHDISKQFGGFLDAVSVAAIAGVIADLITVWASLWTVLWLSIRIYESDTCSRFCRWWRGSKSDRDSDDGYSR